MDFHGKFPIEYTKDPFLTDKPTYPRTRSNKRKRVLSWIAEVITSRSYVNFFENRVMVIMHKIIQLYDRMNNIKHFPDSDLQMLACAIASIVCKIELIYPMKLCEWVSLADDSFTIKSLVSTEFECVAKLGAIGKLNSCDPTDTFNNLTTGLSGYEKAAVEYLFITQQYCLNFHYYKALKACCGIVRGSKSISNIQRITQLRIRKSVVTWSKSGTDYLREYYDIMYKNCTNYVYQHNSMNNTVIYHYKDLVDYFTTKFKQSKKLLKTDHSDVLKLNNKLDLENMKKVIVKYNQVMARLA